MQPNIDHSSTPFRLFTSSGDLLQLQAPSTRGHSRRLNFVKILFQRLAVCCNMGGTAGTFTTTSQWIPRCLSRIYGMVLVPSNSFASQSWSLSSP
jgi:hypothetical protein